MVPNSSSGGPWGPLDPEHLRRCVDSVQYCSLICEERLVALVIV